MGTVVRAELSLRNRYWVGRHRYYELKHFCLQYPEWRKQYAELDGRACRLAAWRADGGGAYGRVCDPTEAYAEARVEVAWRIEMIQKAAEEADGYLAPLLLKAVTEGISYEHLNAQVGVPCCKETWYILYRRFFWLLDKARK